MSDQTTRSTQLLDAQPASQQAQLVYRRSAFRARSKGVIRSVKTAALLRIDRGAAASQGGRSLLKRRSVQPGGFIRSRMTAELLGITPGGTES